MALIKVQLPLDHKKALETGQQWADLANKNLLLYNRGRTHVHSGEYPQLRTMMLEADNGPDQPKGYLKAFVYGSWDSATGRFVIDYDRGFAPLQAW